MSNPARLSVKRLLMIAGGILLGTALASAGSVKPSPSPAKIDPGLYDVLRTFQPGDKIIQTAEGDIDIKGDRVKVVVNLKKPLGMTFAEMGPAGLIDVRKSIRQAQDAVLGRLPADEFKLTLKLSLQHAIAGYVTQAGLRRLQEMPEVASIVPDYVMYMQTIEGRALSRSDDAANNLGARGQGVTVAVTDGGFDYLHSELGGSTPRNDSCPGCANTVVVYMKDFGEGDDDVYPPDCTTGYHGTGTSAIVHRYAPDVHLALLKVFPDGTTSTSTSIMAEGVDWAAANKNIYPSAPIELISMSIGGGKYSGDCPSGTVQTAFDNAKAAGIIAFVSSGNGGFENAMGSPGCDPDVVGVGSVFDADNCNYSPFSPAYCYDSTRQANERICYSNASPALDIYAPSEEVITATAQACTGNPNDTLPLGGTSSAAPAAAGSAAQILSSKTSLKGNKDGLLALMQATGDEVIHSPDPSYQDKRTNVQAAVEFNNAAPVVNSFTATPSTLTAGPAPSIVAASGSSTLAWDCANTASVTITYVSGTFPSSGSATVSPAASTLYTLTASGPGGTATATATVTVTTGGGSMSVNPTSHDYGSQTAGTTSSGYGFTVTNTGAVAMITGSLTLTGANGSEFVIQNDTVSNTSIPPSGVRTFDVAFSPTSGGSKSASVFVSSSVGSGTVALAGNGLGAAGVDLTGSWGTPKKRGSSLSATFTATNAGSDPSPSGFTVSFYLSKDSTYDGSDKFVSNSSVSALGAGATKAIKLKRVNAKRKYHYLVAVVDSGSAVAESNESNNTVVSSSF